MHLDERSAAYFGLGLARASRQPVALLATSGTAAANFFPAIVEARLAGVPLVVLTADRPHELRDNGAPQTIDQLRLYGEHVKWFFDLPEPDSEPELLRLVRALAARAVATALAEPRGPVHLNWPLREPLIPAATLPAAVTPSVRVKNARLAPPTDLVIQLGAELVSQPRGVLVIGPQDDPELADSAARLAGRLGYPILADALSGVRCGSHDRSMVADSFDAFMRDASSVDQLRPQVVLRIGAIPTSKPLQQYLQTCGSARHILIDPGGWRDPSGRATDVLHVDARLLCEALCNVVPAAHGEDWSSRWLGINAATRHALEEHLDGVHELFEGKVFAELGPLLPDGALLYAGNSMPVRDLDTFLPTSGKELRCLANRGANGIDGVVSSALGASAAGTGPVVLAIGDISFYHDMNGLFAARRHGLDILVVLLNNDGGGIFSFLPQAEGAAQEFELLFGTPHGLDFRPFVEAYGGRFVRVDDWPGFRSAVVEGMERGGLQVVEVPTRRPRNVSQHRAVWHAVAAALSPQPVS
jgi:2-succinyl-5-enolpyruvyl-6-hydroxy-3-cyclohexene-1-carboxylate synthase